tara:strand:+ start:205 stop:1176 length:972 start_codon:yes stop_codon:yes gene_type:complete
MGISRKYIIGIVITILLVIGYFIADSILFSGVKARTINENGFQANYFVKTNTKRSTSIVLIGGGQWGDYWGQQFTNRGYSGLSLPYTQREGLPKLPEEINLEYFEKALAWLKKQPEVDPNKIIVMGASRNAELALLLASVFPRSISGVVAYAPSAVSWSNTVLPYNSNELKSSWKYKGLDIPYVPMDKISGNQLNSNNMLEYWNKGLQKADFIGQAAIKVEKINGPILLFSGKDDQVWPSSIMADMIEKRLETNTFEHSFQNIKYENAGHLISSNPDDNTSYRTGTIKISGKDYEYEYGGNDEGNFKAKRDAKLKLMEFLEKI